MKMQLEMLFADMAMGGFNTVLHMLAIAKRKANVNFNLEDINKISKRVSHIE